MLEAHWPYTILCFLVTICIGNSMICTGNSMIYSDIWHKHHEWYFEIVIHNFGEWSLRQFWNITSSNYAKYHIQIMLLFVYTTTRKRFVIFTCRYFKLSWNTTALSQSDCRNFSCSSIRCEIQSEINGIGNVASYCLSSWDNWLLLSYLSWIPRGFFGC